MDKSFKEIIRDCDNKNTQWGTRSLCIEPSLYYEQVKRYLDIFPKKKVKILFFEDLKRNPGKVVKDVYR